MVEGKLLKFVEKKFSGDIIYTSAIPNTRIGGLIPSRQTIPLSLVHPKNAELEYALLDIGVLVPSQHINWRVKLNGISVTKEFKPHIMSPAGNLYFAKLVYDVTSIIKTPEGLRRRRANITFKLEGGDHIIIEQLAILALYSSSEAESTLTYYSGALSLKPGESSSLKINYGGGNGKLRTTIYMPSTIAKGEILLNNNSLLNIENVQGMDEHIMELKSIPRQNIITFKHLETNTTYFPKEMRISNILLYNTEYVKPELSMEETNIPEIIHKEQELEITVSNKGESTPDKAMIVVMSLGNVVARRKIKKLDPGEKTTEKIKIKLQPGEYELVFRIIWGKLSKTWYKDIRYRVKVVE
ncbi:CARDB domain-containing protein [Staphylothermus hellenicus]|uniref:CARDB domain-containing protein n=1 Tax=Staphylothermus hellenicus (strain DSM 12710 / JCM 10830 / BK20S6-10-b1 / P8) TaxID=591019 RepID=D7DBE6_STAHD|nr:CARDB domain-containing protein [Staphylothermus hellenicus]ADI31493.1 hypothetical protein Shell_0361 [Staphylothermus hellenicus DSM 12710]